MDMYLYTRILLYGGLREHTIQEYGVKKTSPVLNRPIQGQCLLQQKERAAVISFEIEFNIRIEGENHDIEAELPRHFSSVHIKCSDFFYPFSTFWCCNTQDVPRHSRLSNRGPLMIARLVRDFWE